MKTLRGAAALRYLREQPMWKLLAAHRAPVIIAMLQDLFIEGDSTLAGSILLERLTRDMDLLRATGEELTQSPQQAVAEWLTMGWLTRRFPAGAAEEEYELSVDALNAIRFITGALKPRTRTTESRLSMVIQQLVSLAEETDDNVVNRLKALESERERIDRQIAQVRLHGAQTLAADRALERTREVISLAEGLTGDFRAVRDEFDRLNRGLRQSLMENEGSRGDVLDNLFAGVDVIGESDAGKTFNAFWRLLTDTEQASTLAESLEALTTRPFSRQLEPTERRFLMGLTSVLLDEGRGVHDVLQNFARSLKSFVQSREFLEQRRLHQLLKQATQAAIATKDSVRANEKTQYELTQTSCRIRSVSQWSLYDPALRVVDSVMETAEPSELDLSAVQELVKHAEIDFRALRSYIRLTLDDQTQASIAQVLEIFPAQQGLGSVIGYVALGAKHGVVTTAHEMVNWQGNDGTVRAARIPAIFFTRDNLHEFLD